MSRTPSPTIYSIPPTVSFTDILAKGLIEETKNNPEKLANYLVLLPTRRGCRSVQEAFLRQSDGKPIMLPRLQPIGDVDGEELFISGSATNIENIPPAMPPLKRQILLSKLIAKLPDFSKGVEQDMRLASALGQLMDQIYTENLDMADLPNIIDREAFADHWQVTIDFLEILSLHWPALLAERGMIDAADRRNRLINALNHHWTTNPPKHPVIAAGSTGSIPSTNNLLKTISTLPQGALLLPGLDKNMSDVAWNMVEEGHPQNTLKELLNNLEIKRDDIKIWPQIHTDHINDKTAEAREKFISHVMAPPNYTHQWQQVNLSTSQSDDLKTSLKKVQRLDCETPQEEAQIIALIMRETLEQEDKTAALITPNRYLARRVAAICQKWNIAIDDSGGQPLNETSIGVYLKLVMQVIISQASPMSLLALLKHELCQGAGFENFRGIARKMDIGLLRGLKPQPLFEGLEAHYHQQSDNPQNRNKPHPDVLNLITHLGDILDPIIKKYHSGTHSFSKLLKTHLEICETLSSTSNKSGEEFLWHGDAGETAAHFLSELNIHAIEISDCSAHDYLNLLDHFMKSMSVRAKYGTHPRLMILGQLEARLIQADRVILSGLNEGIWPPDPGHDPWMSRPMRVDFGLPKAERGITLAAHDFAQGFCSAEVFLTRSKREGGTPTVPARWLQRMDTFLKAVEIDPVIMRQAPYMDYLHSLNKVEQIQPIERPAPTPPAHARPKRLSVTKIETWMKDPYAIYANSVLKLRALDPIEKEISAMERGNVLHKAMEEFTKKYPKNIPDSATTDFIQITQDVLNDQNFDSAEWNFWIPRMSVLSDWLIPHEQNWRTSAQFGKSEIKGEVEFTTGLNIPFTLSGIADRIDYLNTGAVAIIDYKSGGQYSKTKMQSGMTPQLALEALLITEGGFKKSGIHQDQAGYIGYWKLSGGRTAGEITAIDDEEKLQETIETTKKGLLNLIQCFENESISYLALPRLDNAPRFNDFEHLERVKEWAALDDTSEEAA